MGRRVKIRGIYSTALTGLLLDGGHSIVDPLPKIRERFGIGGDEPPEELFIYDADDLQGICLSGEPEKVCQLVSFFQERLVDVALLTLEPFEKPEGLVRAGIEFPGAAKEILDRVRSSVAPTLMRHHRLRILDYKGLEELEVSLKKSPGKRALFEEQCFQEAVFLPLQKKGVVRLEHVRPCGKQVRLREGVLVEADKGRIVFKRTFSDGRYDGLNLPIEKGDYGLTELEEGAWFVRHSYYSKDGRLKGEYHNVNTPVEIYPYGARYLDLEVDVIRRAGEAPFLTDRDKLALLVQEGCIGPELDEKAMQTAHGLMKALGV